MPAIRAARDRHRRNLLATLLLSQGTPMLLMGDELGHGQAGNNNAYCQDGPLTWLDWGEADAALLAFARRLAALRRTHKLLRQQGFLHGRRCDAQGLPDVLWLAEDGQVLSAGQWQDPGRRTLGLRLAGAGDATLLLLLNAGAGPVTFRLPEPGGWRLLLDTAADEPAEGLFAATLAVTGPSLKLLEAVAALSPAPRIRASGRREPSLARERVRSGDAGGRRKAAARRNGQGGVQPGSGEACAGGQPRTVGGRVAPRRAAHPLRRPASRSGRCAVVARGGRWRLQTSARRGVVLAPVHRRRGARPPAAQTSGLRLGPWHRVWRVRLTSSGQRPPRERRQSSSMRGSRWARSEPGGRHGAEPRHGGRPHQPHRRPHPRRRRHHDAHPPAPPRRPRARPTPRPPRRATRAAAGRAQRRQESGRRIARAWSRSGERDRGEHSRSRINCK